MLSTFSLRPVARSRRLLGVLVLGASLLLPAAANAACPSRTVGTPFSAFGDTASYFRIANGGFETTGSWNLTKGARIAAGNESFKVGGANDSRSLVLPVGTGAVATSAMTCVSMETPTMRLFVRSDGFQATGSWGYLAIEGEYFSRTTGASLGRYYLATVNRNDGAWIPSAVIPLVVGGGLNGGQITEANLKLTFWTNGYGAGTISIDDVYIDPYKACC